MNNDEEKKIGFKAIAILSILPTILIILSVWWCIKSFSTDEEHYAKMYAIEEGYKEDFENILKLKDADVNFSDDTVTVTLTSENCKLVTTFKNGTYLSTKEKHVTSFAFCLFTYIFISIVGGFIVECGIVLGICSVMDAIRKKLKKKREAKRK